MLAVLLIFAFITNPEANNVGEPLIWYFYGHPAILVFFICLLAFVLMLITNQLTIDSVVIMLALRIVTCLIPLFYISESQSFSSHYPIVILTVIAYLLGRRKKRYTEHETKAILAVLIFFGCILCFQVFWTFTLIGVPFFDLSYKLYMNIPIALSNVIASYIVPILCCIIPIKNKTIIKIVLITVFFAALILTKSRGGIVTFLITYIFYKLFIKHKFRAITAFGVLIILAFSILFLFSIPEVQLFFMGNSDTMAANSLSSGRLEIFGREFSRGLDHPLFGNGMIFNDKTSVDGAHNLLIELFVQSGIVGLLLYLIPMFAVFRKARKNINNPSIASLYVLTIAIFINGFVEVNFFNWGIDFIFWFVCGVLMNLSSFKIPNEQ